MAIKFNKVNFTYNENTPFQRTALYDIDLEVNQGEFVSIIGHTGSGKSTLVQHMNALVKPTSGVVQIYDKHISKEKKDKNINSVRKKVGLVFQFAEYQLFEETIEKDIMFGPLNFGASKEEAKLKAREVIKTVGLDESFLERSPLNLSGGQMRRVAIAGILAMNPEVLVLDEPTAGLDPQGQIEMMNMFKKLNEEYGTTIILIAHDMNMVAKFSKRIIIMNKGKKVVDDSVDNVFANHDILKKYNLDLPDTAKLLSKIKEKTNLNINVNKFSEEELINEIKEFIK